MTASRTGSAPRADGLAAQAAASAHSTCRTGRVRVISALRAPASPAQSCSGGGLGGGRRGPLRVLVRKLAPLPLLLGPALAVPSDLVHVAKELDRVPVRVQEIDGLVGPPAALSDGSQDLDPLVLQEPLHLAEILEAIDLQGKVVERARLPAGHALDLDEIHSVMIPVSGQAQEDDSLLVHVGDLKAETLRVELHRGVDVPHVQGHVPDPANLDRNHQNLLSSDSVWCSARRPRTDAIMLTPHPSQCNEGSVFMEKGTTTSSSSRRARSCSASSSARPTPTATGVTTRLEPSARSTRALVQREGRSPAWTRS